MYEIYINNRKLYDPNSEKLTMADAKLELYENKAGEFEFVLDPTQHWYGHIKKFTDYINFYQDGELLWRGRVINTPELDFEGLLTYQAEGMLAVLNDSVQRPKSYEGVTITAYLQDLLSNHNEQVEDHKQILLGNVTVIDSNNAIFKTSNYQTTMDCISDKLIDSFGGYISIRYVDGVAYLDYLTDSQTISAQSIRYGLNLTDINQEVMGEDLATVIIPLGAKQDDDTRLTIASVNDGNDYVKNDDAVELYGWIEKVVEYDDVTTATALKTKGMASLATSAILQGSIELGFLDLHFVDSTKPAIGLSDYVLVYADNWEDAVSAIDETRLLKVTALKIYPLEIAKNKITAGAAFTTMTDSTIKADKIINNIVANYVTGQTVADKISGNNNDIVYPLVEQNASLIDQAANEILQSVGQSYVSNDQLESYNESIQSQVADQIEFKFLSVNDSISSVEDVIGNNQSLLEEYIRFRGALIELGKTTSNFTAEFDNESLRFLENGQVIAYISNNKLYIKNAEITNSLSISYYQFQIAPDSGAVSLFYTG